MAPQKNKKKKSGRRRAKASKSRFILPLLLILLLTFTLAATIYFVFLTPGSSRLGQIKKPALSTTGKTHVPPYSPATTAHEEGALPLVEREATDRPAPTPQHHKPRLALLIDDMGFRQKPGRQLIELDLNLTFAILPFTPHGHALMEMARAENREILLHQPMEPLSDKWDPGPGALYTRMAARAIKAQIRKNLEDIPLAVGVNNHMGSKFTSNREAMQAVLAALKERDLFFLDSITIADSVAFAEAARMQVKTGRRDIFIDNDQDEAKIKAQLVKLVSIARRHGSAIGIGHPRPTTIAVLRREANWLKEQVELVPVSSLME